MCCGVDYRDRWRGGLTLRRIWVLLRHLPADSPLVRELSPPSWSITDHLLDDIRMVLTASDKNPPKPHPARPLGERRQLDPKRIAAGLRRRAERQRAIEAGEIT